ncbi:MAG: hypothetical protein R2791_17570 [Saprospiraceae bacterium]
MTAPFAFILIPLILSNVMHMWWVKKDLWPGLAIPVWPRLFGENKTWRGFVVLPLLNGLFSALFALLVPVVPPTMGFPTGFILGLAYMASELPNSLIKRQAGIPPGRSAVSNAWIFTLMDKTDSSLGVSLASHFIFHLSPGQTVLLFLVAVFCHVFFSWLLVLVRLKRHF